SGARSVSPSWAASSTPRTGRVSTSAGSASRPAPVRPPRSPSAPPTRSPVASRAAKRSPARRRRRSPMRSSSPTHSRSGSRWQRRRRSSSSGGAGVASPRSRTPRSKRARRGSSWHAFRQVERETDAMVDVGSATDALAEPDPRVERSRRVILEAVLDELGDVGYGALTIEGVAARAGVGKSTIYRHWSGKLDLVEDAYRTIKVPVEAPETG